MPFKLMALQDIKNLSKGADDWSTNFDTLFNDLLIPAVGELFASYCRRPDFDKAARTEFFSPERPGRSQLFLNSPPVASAPVIQVWEDTETPPNYAADKLLTLNEDYVVHEELGIVERYAGWFPQGKKTVKVTYTGGYLIANGQGVPADLRLAAIAQCKIFFEQRDNYGITGRSLEGGSINLLNILTLPMQVTKILDRYRLSYA